MTINIGNCPDDIRVVNKTFNSSISIDAQIVENTDLLTPQLTISHDLYQNSFNYLYIPHWNRYYYVSDVNFDSSRTILNCKIDVLKTYANQIKGFTGVLSRSGGLEKATYIPDKMIPLTGQTETKYISFPHIIDTSRGDNIVLITSSPNNSIEGVGTNEN